MLDNFVKTMKSKIGEAMEKFSESVENFIINSITKRQEARKKNKEKEAEKKQNQKKLMKQNQKKLIKQNQTMKLLENRTIFLMIKL